MRDIPLLIPILLILFVSLGLARVKTILVVGAFSLFFVYGYLKGENIGTPRRRIEVNDDVFSVMLILSVIIILIQIANLRGIPLLHPHLRTHLNPKLTGLTYFLGLPSSVYLIIRGKKLGFLYPLMVALYAYRTPVLVALIALTLPYLEDMKKGKKAVEIGVIGIFLLFLISYFRGSLSFLTRIQGTTSVLDVIVKRCSVVGFYKGELQLAGVKSYIFGGLGPRTMIARYLGIPGVTITATLIGGMYLDFGLLSSLEMLLLGFYYGIMKS